jgi:hypothetical protein
MERDIIDEATTTHELGTVSVHTEGGMGDIIEPMGLWHKAGISDE